MNKFVYHYGNDNFGQTKIENIFINEFMADANGDYIKVYLYGLKDSQNPDLVQLSTEEIAEKLHMTESDVLRAWNYWKDQGIIELEEVGSNRKITYLNITEAHYYRKGALKGKREEPESDAFGDLVFEVERMYGGSLTLSWNQALSTWFYDYGMEPETILFAVQITLDKLLEETTSQKTHVNYASAIIKNWHKAKIISYKDALLYTQETQDQNAVMYGVLKRLGIKNRGISANERKIMKRWFKDYHFDKLMIYEAANRSQISRVDYVDGILKRWYQNGWTSPDQIIEEAPRRMAKQKPKAIYNEPQVSQDRLDAARQYEEELLASYIEQVADFNEVTETE